MSDPEALTNRSGRSTEVPDDIRQMAVMIITGLLREEGWELPDTSDEEITTRRLELALWAAVNKLVAERLK